MKTNQRIHEEVEKLVDAIYKSQDFAETFLTSMGKEVFIIKEGNTATMKISEPN